MKENLTFKLQGTAFPNDARQMLDAICEHFVETVEVDRASGLALLKSQLGTARIHMRERALLIELACPSEEALHLSRSSLAEHLFYFAGGDPFELTWSEPASHGVIPNLYEARVIGAENVTPHMRRVRFSCADVGPLVGADLHVRVLIPPKGRRPVWPGYRDDGRIGWPGGADELLVRLYTIRGIDVDRRELWIDFLQHPIPGVATPGADFARDAQPGDVVALLGPAGGGVPSAKSILLVGDESALPAIARIAEEAPQRTEMRAIIEVLDAEEEQTLASNGNLDIRWLHRRNYAAGAGRTLKEEARKAIIAAAPGTFVWIACEKDDVRSIRSLLEARKHDRRLMYAAWYWQR